MLTGIHFLLTYACTCECDHCFLYCSPRRSGTFTLEQIRTVLDDALKIGSVNSIYFEGGEPFLYYPLLLAACREARNRSFEVGLVTNAYWATSQQDAHLWLKPFVEIGLSDLSISDDKFHQDSPVNTATFARAAALELGLPADAISIEPPSVCTPGTSDHSKGEPVVGGGVKFRGRAVDKLASDLPKRNGREFRECPDEDLANPSRMHVDSFGNVHLCQGLLLGNLWQVPLSRLLAEYRPEKHPLVAPLMSGGPALLAKAFAFDLDGGFVDECHLCFAVRRKLLPRFPEYLAPRAVYGDQFADDDQKSNTTT